MRIPAPDDVLPPNFWMRLLLKLLVGLVVITGAVMLRGWLFVRTSLPVLDGEAPPYRPLPPCAGEA